MFPIETNAEKPRRRSDAFSSSARPSAPLWEENAIGPGRERPRAEGGVEAERRDRDPEAVRADQPPAVRADELEQPRLPLGALRADLGEARRDHAERLDPERERLLGRPEDVLSGEADHDEIDDLGQLRERSEAADAADGLAVAVDRVGRALEVGGEDVAKQLAADRPSPVRRADDRQRARLEERPQRGGHGAVIALVHTRPERLRRGDRKRDLDRAAVELACGVEARVPEDREHRGVLGQHLGDEALDPGGRGSQGELLEEPGADPAPLMIVRDRERHLGAPLVAQPHELRHGDDLVCEDADEDAAVAPVRVGEVLDEGPVDGAHAVKAQVEAPVREAGEERLERVEVVGRRRAQPQRRAVPQDHVDRAAECVETLIESKSLPCASLVPEEKARNGRAENPQDLCRKAVRSPSWRRSARVKNGFAPSSRPVLRSRPSSRSTRSCNGSSRRQPS